MPYRSVSFPEQPTCARPRPVRLTSISLLARLTVAALALLGPACGLSAEPAGSAPRNYLALPGGTLFLATTPDPSDPFGQLTELWRTDGTAAGTYEVVTCPASCDPRVQLIAHSPTTAFFTAYDETFEWQVWATDGTQAGTRRLTDFDALGQPTGGAVWARQQGRLYFFAEEVGGWGLWISDGSPQGTRRLHLFPPPAFTPFGLAEHAGATYFFVSPSDLYTGNYELWRSDGTSDTTRHLATLAAYVDSHQSRLFTSLPGGLLFPATAYSGDAPPLWRTDGTTSGTGPLAVPGLEGLDAPFPELTVVGDEAFFWGSDSTHGRQLWRTDGTAAGTTRLSDFPFGNYQYGYLDPLPWQGGVLFSAQHPDYGFEIWSSDGTAAGTHLLLDLCPGPCSNTPIVVHAAADRFYFIQGPFAQNLWVSDGTLAGTHGVEDVEISVPSLTVPALLLVGDRLFFRGAGAGEYEQLWTLDPAGENVRRLTRLFGFRPFGYEWSVGSVGNRFLFTADDGFHGLEPWISDGTPQGTHMVADLVTGGDGLASCEPNDRTLCLHDRRFRVTVDWHDQHNGGDGFGHALVADGSDRSGYFWFFRPDNVELIVKVLDGSNVNGFYWSFYGALTDVEYDATVVDTVSGELRTYHNPPGEICGEGDTRSLRATGSAATAGSASRTGRLELPAEDALLASPRAAETCVPDAETLCLLDGRFRVRVAWQDQHNGGSGVGGALPYTDRTGFFWFFRPDNVELVVKALDGRAINGNFWLFYGALSDVGYTLTVEDLVDGQAVRSYVNPPGEICGRGDTVAFP